MKYESIRVVVLLSGSGRTLQNLLNYISKGMLSINIVKVISDRENALGIEKARNAGLSVEIVNRSHSDFSNKIFEICRKSCANLVCLAGFLSLLKIPEDFNFKVINIHPSLLPEFGGKGMYGNKVHDAVLKSGRSVSGCTIHYVDNEYDHGEIILQKKVEVKKDDTVESLSGRVFAEECKAYPEAIKLLIK